MNRCVDFLPYINDIYNRPIGRVQPNRYQAALLSQIALENDGKDISNDRLGFMKLIAFGRCTGISFVDSTMIPVCHNLRRYANKVFKGMATNGKGTMGWCHGFKLYLLCNDSGDIMTFCLTGANVDDRDKRVWTVFA